MSGKVLVKVPQLLQDRGLGPLDLMYGARLSVSTAYSLASPEKSQATTAMSFDVLARLCQYFQVGVSEILEYKEEEGS